MAQKQDLKENLKEKILNYITLLEKEGVHIKKAIVFGSYAKGRIKPWSDIDLCLVSEQFGKHNHPLDLKEKYDPLAAEIRKHGIVVF